MSDSRPSIKRMRDMTGDHDAAPKQLRAAYDTAKAFNDFVDHLVTKRIHAILNKPRPYITKMNILTTGAKTSPLTPTPAYDAAECNNTEFYKDCHGYILKGKTVTKLVVDDDSINDRNMSRVIGTEVDVQHDESGSNMGRHTIIGVIRYSDGVSRGEIPTGPLLLWVGKGSQ